MAKRKNKITQEEIGWLRANYPYEDMEYITSHLGRNADGIRHIASKLGIKRIKNSVFSQQEDDLIMKYWRDVPEEEFMNDFMPYRSIRSIQIRASKLGIRRVNPWTDEEDEVLRREYTSHTMEELSQIIGNHTRESVYNRVKKLGLTNTGRFKYSESDIEYIKSNHESMSDEEIGLELNRTSDGIKIMREKLGLYKLDPSADTRYISILKFIQANNTLWKKMSMEHCGFKCIISGENFNDIHHLYSKNLILADILAAYDIPEDFDINTCSEELRQSILSDFLAEQMNHPLGVCLSKELHKLFHIRYGFGNNTPEQFIEFVSNVSPDRADYIKDLIA